MGRALRTRTSSKWRCCAAGPLMLYRLRWGAWLLSHCSSLLSLVAQVSLSAPCCPSPPCSPSDDEVSVRLFSKAARQQDGVRESSYSKTGIGVTLVLRSRPVDSESELVHRTRLAKRVFRDVDSLAAARSEAKMWMQRAKDAEAQLRRAQLEQIDWRQHTLVEHRTFQLQVHDLEARLQAQEKETRWRHNERKAAEAKASESQAKALQLRDEMIKYKREAEAAALKLTAAERGADVAKAKYEHLKEDLRRSGEGRARLSDDTKLLRDQLKGAYAPPLAY